MEHRHPAPVVVGSNRPEHHMSIAEPDLETLRLAVLALERPSLPARLASMVGKPVELLAGNLPFGASQIVSAAVRKGLEAALKVALATLKDRPAEGSNLLHKSLAVASGAIGGALGAATLAVELPVSTIVMFRSIADIAKAEGEDLHDPETALACLQVFALGGASRGDDATESAYFAVRSFLARSTAEAARYITERGVIEEGAPHLVRFLAKIASRFGVVVSHKFAAQAVPVIGAFGGAVVNYAFIDHFQTVARGHFAVRRLERLYGKDAVRAEYDRIRGEISGGQGARSASTA
jgi:hypothetical protein